MKVTRVLLTGERARLDVPDAVGLPPAVGTAVVDDAGRELEVNASDRAGREFFLGSTGSRLTGSVEVRGLTLRYGALGGRASSGRVYSVAVADQHVWGSCGGRLPLADLARTVGRLGLESRAGGVVMDPVRGVSWSRRMPVSVAQVVDLGADRGFLLDVRRTRTAPTPGRAGRPVAGGLLTRSGAQERSPYLVLEADDLVGYGLPRPGTPLDDVADAMTRVRLDLIA